MRLNKLAPTPINWDTVQAPQDYAHLSHSSHALCEATGVHQCADMGDVRGLNEATYKELGSMIDGNFLRQKVRAEVLNGIKLDAIEDNTMRFRINSSEFEKNRIQYMCSVQFDEWDEYAQDPDLNFAEKARMLLWVGNIRLGCTCPSFLYWGYAYLLTTLDASIYPEERKPHIRNPQERGIVCKHLNRILQVLPFYSGQMAGELKRQYGNP